MRKVKGVSKGLADIPEITPDGFAKDLSNYEFVAVDAITKRVQMNDWGEGLATLMGSESFDVIKVPDYPYYAPNLPSDIHQDFRFLLPIFVFSIYDGYQLILAYKKNSGTWTYKNSDGDNLLSGIYGDGVIYTEQSDLVFSYGRYLYISDGVNNCQYVAVEKDGTIRSGIMGLLAPDKLQTVIEKEIKIEQSEAEKIALEINRFILYPVKEALGSLYKIEFAPGGKIVKPKIDKSKVIKNKTKKTSPKDTYRESVN
jgi:hypothetical protein